MSSHEKFTSNPLFRLGEKLADLMLLSVLWAVFSLPILTAGPATSALYYAIYKRFDKESETPFRDFWHSFRENLRQGIVLSSIYLLYSSFVAFDIYLAFGGSVEFMRSDIMKQISIALLLPILLTVPYTFAYHARFRAKVLTVLKNSFTFCAMHPLHTLGILLILCASGAGMFFFPPCLLLVPALAAYLISRLIEKDFRLILAENLRREEARNSEENTHES